MCDQLMSSSLIRIEITNDACYGALLQTFVRCHCSTKSHNVAFLRIHENDTLLFVFSHYQCTDSLNIVIFHAQSLKFWCAVCLWVRSTCLAIAALSLNNQRPTSSLVLILLIKRSGLPLFCLYIG
jgi:hypothetical protein